MSQHWHPGQRNAQYSDVTSPPKEAKMERVLRWLTWPAALFIAAILLWYEQYKLTGNPGSVSLFTTLTDWLGFSGHEKAMRLGVAGAEIAASLLVLVPPTRVIGGGLAFCIMSGAIFFHLVSPLGVDPYGDGGALFKQACEVWLASAFILLVRREDAWAVSRDLAHGKGRFARSPLPAMRVPPTPIPPPGPSC